MKQFDCLTVNMREQTKATLNELVSKCSPVQIEAVKKIFWDTVEKSGGQEAFLKLEPKWCNAIDELPNTNNFHRLNEIHLEISVDILKKAMWEKILWILE